MIMSFIIKTPFLIEMVIIYLLSFFIIIIYLNVKSFLTDFFFFSFF